MPNAMLQRIGRDPLFDIVKFFAIFAVVFFHTAEAGCSPDTFASLRVIDNFRLGVNMPIFFAISGYFAAPTLLNVEPENFHVIIWRKESDCNTADLVQQKHCTKTVPSRLAILKGGVVRQ